MWVFTVKSLWASPPFRWEIIVKTVKTSKYINDIANVHIVHTSMFMCDVRATLAC